MRIGIIGDLILSNQLEISDDVLKILRSTDFNIANLEAPFIKPEFRPVKHSGLHQLVNDFSILNELNIAVVSLANNHIGDFGHEGIHHTRNMLSDNKIHCFGAGQNLEEALTPAVLTVHGTSIAFWGFMLRSYSNRYFASEIRHGIPKLSRELILSELRNSNADVKILYNHWNQEFEYYPEPICKALAEEVINYCTIIIGSHPHCIQGIDSRYDSLILYSMGNFSVPVREYYGTSLPEYPELSMESMIVTASINDDTIQYELHPILLNKAGTRIMSPDDERKTAIDRKVQLISRPLKMTQREYRTFYNKNKRRKLRFTLSNNERFNVFIMFIYIILSQIMQIIEQSLALLLDKIGLLSYVKKRMPKLIAYFQSIR